MENPLLVFELSAFTVQIITTLKSKQSPTIAAHEKG
jgi:hypothetical protein